MTDSRLIQSGMQLYDMKPPRSRNVGIKNYNTTMQKSVLQNRAYQPLTSIQSQPMLPLLIHSPSPEVKSSTNFLFKTKSQMQAHQHRLKFGLHSSTPELQVETYSNENLIQEITNRVTANLKQEDKKPVQYVELSKVETKQPAQQPNFQIPRPSSLRQMSSKKLVAEDMEQKSRQINNERSPKGLDNNN